jgi:hypothetical protein
VEALMDVRKIRALAEQNDPTPHRALDRGPVHGPDLAEHLAAVAYDIDDAMTSLRWSLTKLKDSNRTLRLDLQALMVLMREAGVGLPALGLFSLAKLQSVGLTAAIEVVTELMGVCRRAQHEVRRARGAGGNLSKKILHLI